MPIKLQNATQKGGETMAKEKEILRKQLELLAEKSNECVALDDLILISNAMCNIANVLIAL